MEQPNENIKKTSLNKIRQFNISSELVDEFGEYMSSIELKDEQMDKICSFVERMVTQHYVRQMLKQEYGK
jgi:hypothetical protein